MNNYEINWNNLYEIQRTYSQISPLFNYVKFDINKELIWTLDSTV